MNRKDIRNAALCALVVLAAFFLTNPFVQIPFNDDWIYSYTVRQLAQTGKLVYCGESAGFLMQACWGAAVARIFHFSFVALRFSTLPFSMTCAALCYLLARRANLDHKNAFFVSILLALSPLFLPLAASFMTDVPALACILLSLYCLAESLESQRPWIWLAAAYIAALAGGLDRQIVWIVPLTCGPYVACLRRKDAAVLFVSALGFAGNLVVAFAFTAWFATRPGVVTDWTFFHTIQVVKTVWADSLIIWLCVWLTTLLLILPAAIPVVWSSIAQTCNHLRGRRGLLAASIAVAIALVSVHWPAMSIEPWLGDVVSPRGPLSGMELSGYRPVSQPPFLRALFGILVIIAAWSLVTELADRCFRPRLFPIPKNAPPVVVMMLIFDTVYLVLLAYRAPRGFIYDRYALPLIPCVAIPLLLKSQNQRCPIPIKILAWTMLALWSLYGIAATQDVHALQQARQTAMDRVLDAGNPDTSIADGSEFDNWTQLLHQGYVNIPGINSPPGKYDPALGICPALRPLYRVEFLPTPDTAPSEFGSVDYLSWLPPFHRRIFIDRFRDPYWLDPNNNTPPPKDFEDFHLH
jgi:Dolichyl-phosphate-mannose-protein mannosyltransferase